MTRDFLNDEYNRGGWAVRLDDCKDERVSEITENEDGQLEYHTRIVTHHYENGVLIAVTISRLFHDRPPTLKVKMLLIHGIPHQTR